MTIATDRAITIDQTVIRKTGWAQDAMYGVVDSVAPSKGFAFVRMVDGKLRRFDLVKGCSGTRYQDDNGGVLYYAR